MLYRDHEKEEWKLMPLKATFLQHEKPHEQYVISEDDLKPYEEMNHIEELEFKKAEYEQGVINRLNEVKNYPESELNAVHEYVMNNKVLEGTVLAEEKTNDMLLMALVDIDMQREMDKMNSELALAELAEIILGGGF